jgi:hypothetical protein
MRKGLWVSSENYKPCWRNKIYYGGKEQKQSGLKGAIEILVIFMLVPMHVEEQTELIV